MRTDETFFYWYKGDGELLAYGFKADEFSCHCNQCKDEEQKISKKLIERLEVVRHLFARPIVITSGYRCAQHQQELRDKGFETAVGKSSHELGEAADVTCGNVPRLAAIANNYFKSLGLARTWMHVDTRDDKERRWSYKL
jgi:zinc D-Ala-D-Ala carboxypeptidase